MNVLVRGKHHLIFRKFLVSAASLFFLCLLNHPIYAGLLQSFKHGEIFRLPGSELSSVLIDQDGDGTVDGIDFDHDEVPELRFVNINYERAVGIDDNQDNKPDFYIVQTKKDRLIITHTLKTREIRRLLSDEEVSLKKILLWSDMAISMIGGYGISFGTFSDTFPNALGGALYIEQGLDRILSALTGLRRHSWFPGLRIAGGYSIYNSANQPTRVSWISLQMGPLWRIPIHPEHSGYFAISLLAGTANLNIRTTRGVREGFVFSSDLTLSYEYRMEDVHFIFQPSGRYIRSSESIFIQFNVSVGVGYNIRL